MHCQLVKSWKGGATRWVVGSVFGVDTRQRKKFDLFSNGHSSGETKDEAQLDTHYIEMMNLYNSAGQCISSLSQHPLNK